MSNKTHEKGDDGELSVWVDRLGNFLVLTTLAAGIHGFALSINSTLTVSVIGYLISLLCAAVLVLLKPKNHLIEKLALQICYLAVLVAIPAGIHLLKSAYLILTVG